MDTRDTNLNIHTYIHVSSILKIFLYIAGSDFQSKNGRPIGLPYHIFCFNHRAAVVREAHDREAVRLENGIEFFFLPLILHTVVIKINISKYGTRPTGHKNTTDLHPKLTQVVFQESPDGLFLFFRNSHFKCIFFEKNAFFSLRKASCFIGPQA